jgi:hypothetical protein
MSEIRNIILKHMIDSGLTIYRVSQMVENRVPQRTVYDFLSGKTDTTTEVAWAIINALRMTIKPSDESFLKRVENMDERCRQIKAFIDADEEYIQWVMNNPSGFVLNCERKPTPKYLMLHKANCRTVRHATRGTTKWTSTGYIKICANSITAIEKWAEMEVGGEVRPCKKCSP